MTQVERTRLNARYLGVVYGIDLLDHVTRQVVPNDYVGKTRQRGRARENQHRDSQAFSDLIVGSPHVLWEGMCTEDELDEIEWRLIRELSPRMNWVHNEDNPQQIPKWVQLEQRHQRDDAVGRPRWVPLDQRHAASLLDQRTAPRTAAASSARPASATWWKLAQRRAVTWPAGWLLLALCGWAAFDEFDLPGSWKARVVTAAVLATGLLVWGVRRRPDTWRVWRRRLRKWLR